MAPTRWEGGAVYRPGTRTRQLVLVLALWWLDPVPLYAHPAYAQTLPGYPCAHDAAQAVRRHGAATLPYLGTIERQEGIWRTACPSFQRRGVRWNAVTGSEWLSQCDSFTVGPRLAVRSGRGSGRAVLFLPVVRVPLSLPHSTLSDARTACMHNREPCCSPRCASAAAGPACQDLRSGGRTHALCLCSPVPDGLRAARVRLRG